MTPRARIARAALLFLLAACAHRSRKPGDPPPPDDRPEWLTAPVVVEIVNHNWSDVVVYVIHDGIASRFAQVTATRTLTVPLPARLRGSNGVVRFRLHRIGGDDDYTPESVSLTTGFHVVLTAESSLAHSTIGIW